MKNTFRLAGILSIIGIFMVGADIVLVHVFKTSNIYLHLINFPIKLIISYGIFQLGRIYKNKLLIGAAILALFECVYGIDVFYENLDIFTNGYVLYILMSGVVLMLLGIGFDLLHNRFGKSVKWIAGFFVVSGTCMSLGSLAYLLGFPHGIVLYSLFLIVGFIGNMIGLVFQTIIFFKAAKRT